MTIGCFIGSCAAALIVTGGTNGNVTYNGRHRGLYVDDETPSQCQAVRQDYEHNPRELIFASQWGMDSRVHTCPHSVTLLEWYPYWAAGAYEAPPCGWRGYIVQWKFQRPTRRQRERVLHAVESCRPRWVVKF